MSHPHTLSGLSEREQIADALYRVVIGYDRNDVAIFNTAFAGEDASFEIRAGADVKAIQGLSKVRDFSLAQVGPLDTSHMISNIRIDLKDGADTAHLTCYALSQHCPPGKGMQTDGPKYLVGGEYFIDYIKVDGQWKIKKWVLDVIWRQGDASVMQSASG